MSLIGFMTLITNYFFELRILHWWISEKYILIVQEKNKRKN